MPLNSLLSPTKRVVAFWCLVPTIVYVSTVSKVAYNVWSASVREVSRTPLMWCSGYYCIINVQSPQRAHNKCLVLIWFTITGGVRSEISSYVPHQIFSWLLCQISEIRGILEKSQLLDSNRCLILITSWIEICDK